MKRARLIALAIGLGLVALLAAPAGAQDGPTITVDPLNVEAAGEQEFTVVGEGWTAEPPIFVLPCFPVNTLEDLAAQGAAACDTAALTPATPADGAFEATVTYDVPAEGMCIASGDAAQSEGAFVCITVGAAAEGGEEAEGEGEEAPAEGEEAEGEGEEELANTGVESGLLAIVAVAIIAAGAMVVRTTRRFA